jgi:hypothetical protein
MEVKKMNLNKEEKQLILQCINEKIDLQMQTMEDDGAEEGRLSLLGELINLRRKISKVKK